MIHDPFHDNQKMEWTTQGYQLCRSKKWNGPHKVINCADPKNGMDHTRLSIVQIQKMEWTTQGYQLCRSKKWNGPHKVINCADPIVDRSCTIFFFFFFFCQLKSTTNALKTYKYTKTSFVFRGVSLWCNG